MINAIIGGSLIGLAVSMMLLFNGKVTGISGILGNILNSQVRDKNWRLIFIGGLLSGGVILKVLNDQVFVISSKALLIDYLIAGFLVGFGTLLGNGCTSGHGVCGISRLSPRSLIATVTFILAGVVSVIIFRALRGEL